MNRDQSTTFTTSTTAALESRATGATRRDELHKCSRNSGDRTVTKTTPPPTTIKSSMKSLSPLRRRPKIRDPFTPAAVKRTRKQTVVSFADNAQVIAVAPLVGELAEDPNEIWWSEFEIDKISTKAHAIAQKLQSGTCARRYCTRGLEDILYREEVEEAQSAAWEAVLKVQGEQRQRLNRGDANDAAAASEQAISMAYMRTSWGSKMAATKRAIRDEEEIRKDTKDTRRMMAMRRLGL